MAWQLSYAGGSLKDFFWDGREQLKDNLIFLLRAATRFDPFLFASSIEEYFWFEAQPDYAWSDYLWPISEREGESPAMEVVALRPFEDNYYLRNFVFSEEDVSTWGFPTTGVDAEPYLPLLHLDSSPTHEFTPPPSPTNVLDLLPPQNSRWIFQCYAPIRADIEAMGVTYDNPYLEMAADDKNIYGLPFLSAMMAYSGSNGVETNVLAAGGAEPAPSDGWLYGQTAAPILENDGYCWRNLASGTFPGYDDFTATNPSPLLITSAGQSIMIAGYAKLAILNGYADRFGYLGQYFDKAYRANPDGTASTNETGFLSPYGEFFPTEPGRAILTTMPDGVSTNVGECTVHVIGLNVDANHDGVMDLSYTGLDHTSQNHPMVFWVNNDYDSAGLYGDPDRDVNGGTNLFDYNYSDGIYGNGQPCIHSKRDLEDYARLWICGMPGLATNAGYQVTMSWGSVSSGNPKIHLFRAVETNGGTLYLTDTNVAAAQAEIQTYVPNTNMAYYIPGTGISIGTVAPGSTFTFPSSFFTNSGNKYLLFEGAGIGDGELRLTISQGTNVLAQTSTWLDLHDVEDFYERGRGTNVTSGLPPSDLVSQYQVLAATSALPNASSKHAIVHVHGINISEFQWKVERDTIFKRLYWSGYDGRFASFRWSCAYLPFENTLNPFNYNLGEFYAYKSATALKNYLTYLRNRPDLAGYSLDILAHSQGNVITSEAIHQDAPFDNYILTQASTPAHCYDTYAPFLQKLLIADTNKPTPFYTTNGGYHGYFTNLNDTGGRLINFFNTNDFALVSGTYFGHQANWEADQETQKPENFIYRLGPEYTYYPSSGRSIATIVFDRDVTDPHEIMAMVARSRSRAAGAQGGLGGPIGSSVDLKVSFGFDVSRDEHSAQITRPIQTVWQYYNRVMVEFGLQPTLQP